MMTEELREQLIRQFPAEVIETKGELNKIYYSCQACGRPVSRGMDKCGCGQVLSWKNIKTEEISKGIKKATLEFEVPIDFSKGDCRKCPISYIGKNAGESVYECPLKMRGSCSLNIS